MGEHICFCGWGFRLLDPQYHLASAHSLEAHVVPYGDLDPLGVGAPHDGAGELIKSDPDQNFLEYQPLQ